MFWAFDTGGLLSGSIPTVGVVVTAAVLRLLNNRREHTASAGADVVERLIAVELAVTQLNNGLFGEETRFGRKPGFVDEVRAAIPSIASPSV